MCLFPKLIDNPKYRANKKNRGVIPPIVDNRVLLVPIGCGNCVECRKQKARNWQVRLHEELRYDNNVYFITFSFSNENWVELSNSIKGLNGYELDNEIATLATRRFLERWRKRFKKSVKHWFVTELGGKNTERIHIHGLLWTVSDKVTIEDIWKYGSVWVGDYVTDRTIGYIVKYIHKIDSKHLYFKSKILTSPGIGKHYISRFDSNNNMFNGVNTNERYRARNGQIMGLPIYYKNHLYTEQERELLWLHKLDNNKRWVLGQEIDISEGLDGYYNVLGEAQEKNKRLGYTDGEVDWNKKRYEWERRLLKHREKILKTNAIKVKKT